MSGQTRGSIHSASEGGLTGKHGDPPPFQFFTGPSTGNELNNIVLRLIPIACWRVEDIRFAFDSSFVMPDITAELQALVDLREQHRQTQAGGR